MQAGGRGFSTWVLMVCLAGGTGASAGAAQEKEAESNAAIVAKSAGIGALLGAVLGGSAAAGAAISAGASVALKKPGSVAKTAGATDQAEPEVHRKGETAVRSDEEIIAAIGPSNWDAYEAMRDCDYAAAADHAAKKADSDQHQLASQWLKAMIALDSSQDAEAKRAFAELVEVDPDIRSGEQARDATSNLVLEMRSERIDLKIGPCR